MKKHIYDDNNGLSYTLHGDYYLPDLVLPEEEPVTYGKYGMLRRIFLKEYKKGIYSLLLTQGKLVEHLNQVDRDANDKMELLVRQMAKRQGVTEKLKEENQMLWVGRMNNINNAAEEIVLKELVYV
ncbi:TnpV protein [Blautia producta]|uniref:TnpV protein n=2 Tax=Blautia producta TaxID=33035 RepID=A0A7G5MPS1_9FIRM|nr:TnpV protein [Blautia producta]QIB55525.1 TnpV protein [Blautia producta ATCC 27340 = DSM 2950]QMW76614.1 TnpV protein [Blautia producta]